MVAQGIAGQARQNGWLIAALALAAGMSVLRWPVRYLLRWVGRVTGLARSGNPD